VWGSLRSRKPAIKWLVEVISLLDNGLRGNESVAVFPGGNWTRTTPQPTVAPSLSSSPHGNYCEALELRLRTPVSLKCGEQKGGDETYLLARSVWQHYMVCTQVLWVVSALLSVRAFKSLCIFDRKYILWNYAAVFSYVCSDVNVRIW